MATVPRDGWSTENQETAQAAGWESWEQWVLAVEEKVGHEVCGGRNRHQAPCELRPGHGVNRPATRCKHHGGPSPVGPGSPHWKDGSHSAYAKLTARIDARAQDPNLIASSRSIATADERIHELLSELAEGGASWDDASHTLLKFKAAQGGPEAVATFRAHEQVVSQGAARQDTWRELADWLETRRRLADTERKRMVDAHEMIHRDRAMAFFRVAGMTLRDGIDDIVTDVKQRQKLMTFVAGTLRDYYAAEVAGGASGD